MKILFFHASYCGACPATQLAAILYAEQIHAKFQAYHVQDVYGGHELAKKLHVKHVPCTILLDDSGKESARMEGGRTLEEMQEIFEKAIKKGAEHK